MGDHRNNSCDHDQQDHDGEGNPLAIRALATRVCQRRGVVIGADGTICKEGRDYVGGGEMGVVTIRSQWEC